MADSWSNGGSSDDNDFEAPSAPILVSPAQRAALTLATVNEVIQTYLRPDWSARTGQYEVTLALWRGDHVVCTFPTSAGKTLIMMLPALVACHVGAAGIWVVCQPLEALRKTTVKKIKMEFFSKTNAVIAVWLDESPEQMSELQDTLDDVVVLFCSPEQLDRVYRFLRQSVPRVSGLLIDEAHLRFAWKFRDYAATDRFSTLFPAAVIGLFSATLNPGDAAELARLMAMRNVTYFTELEFPELRVMKLQRWDQFTLRCISMRTDQVVAAIVDMFTRLPEGQSIIVFAASYSKLAKLAEPLARTELKRFAPRLYSSVFKTAHKEASCDLLNSGRCRLVGATCALGAGVDLVNVGAVLFFGCPKTFSDATQGMGRAGRGAGKSIVEVVIATDSSSNSKADNFMRLLVGYCSEAKSTKKVTCSLCQTQRMRPGIEGAASVYKTCFDFAGVHCHRDTRPACKLVMCKVFDNLLPQDALGNADMDCGRCGSCKPPVIEIPLQSLVRYKGANAIVWGFTDSLRCQIREIDSLTSHTVARTSLTLVSSAHHSTPPSVETNKLRKREKELLVCILEERFLASSLGMLLCSVPCKAELARLAKWSAKDCAVRCSVSLPNANMIIWFESAQVEAKKRADDEKNRGVIVNEADDDEEKESEAEEAEEAADDEAFGKQIEAATVSAMQDVPFVLSSSLRASMSRDLDALRAAMAERAAIAEAHVARRRRPREEEEEEDGDEVAFVFPKPKSARKVKETPDKKARRRNTIS